MVMTNVQKETKRKYLNIDTRFRDDYNDSSNSSHIEHIITLPQSVTDVKSIMICNAEVPITYYNISASLGNNAFGVSFPTATGQPVNSIGQPTTSGVVLDKIYTIILNDGNYDITGLIAAINTKLANNSPNLSSEIVYTAPNVIDTGVTITSTNLACSFSTFKSVSGFAKIHFDIKGNLDCNWRPSTTSTNDKFNYKTKLGYLLGYKNLTFLQFKTKDQLIKSDAGIDMNGPRYLYITVDEFSKGNQNSFISPLSNSIINKNILSRVNYDTRAHPFGYILSASIITGTLLSDRRSYTGKIDLQKLKVQLVNEYGIPVNLNGMDFSFCLEIEHE